MLRKAVYLDYETPESERNEYFLQTFEVLARALKQPFGLQSLTNELSGNCS